MRKRLEHRLLAGLGAAAMLLLSACGAEPATSSRPATPSSDDGIFNLESDVFNNSSSETGSNPASSTGSNPDSSSPSSGADISHTQDTDKKHAAFLPKMNVANKTLHILRNSGIKENTLLKEAYGITVDVTVVDSATLLTRFVTMAASGSGPDLFFYDFNSQLIARKYVQAWDSYVDLGSDIWKDVKNKLDTWKVGGKHYYLYPESEATGYCLFNKEIFDEYGCTYPSKLFEQGKWDWNAMQQLVQKLTIDSNKDGVPEIYGLFTNFGPYQWVASTGHEYVQIVNGTPKNMMLTSNVSRAISAFQKVYKTGGYYYGSDELDAFLRGEVAMYEFITAAALYRDDVIQGIKSGKYGFTAVPKDPQADKYYTCGTTAGYFLPSNSQNVEAAVAFMTVLRYQASNKEYLADARKELLSKGEGWTQEMYDTFDTIQSKVTPVQDTWNHMGAELLPVITGIGSELFNGKSWSQIASEFSPTVDGIIKNYMSQTQS